MKIAVIGAGMAGLTLAQRLGVRYRSGIGVIKDYKEAMQWSRLAAEQGNANAQANIGALYFYGQGVPKDDKETVKWQRLAAEQGHARSQRNLGLMYKLGLGVKEDAIYGNMWLNIAASNGDEDAANEREATGGMTESDISKAQDLARECVKKNYKGC